MDKKTLLVMASLCASLTTVQAQKKNYEKMVYTDVSVEGENMTVVGKDIVSTLKEAKFKIRITNKSDEVILFIPDESAMKLDGKEVKPFEKPLDIPPNDVDFRVINFPGPKYMVPAYSYEITGLYKVSTTKNVVETPDFMLPPASTTFKTGNFTCDMMDVDKKTDKTTVKFECRYTGDKVGVINPWKTAVKLPDGTEIATAKSKKNSILLTKGESKKFTLVWERMEGGKATDMQKIKLPIVWHDCFVEADPIKLKPVTLDFKLDEANSK